MNHMKYCKLKQKKNNIPLWQTQTTTVIIFLENKVLFSGRIYFGPACKLLR